MPGWCTLRPMRMTHLLIYVGMCVGIAVLFHAGPLAALGPWLPAWAKAASILLLVFGGGFGLVFFVGLMVFQFRLRRQRFTDSLE